MSKERLSLIRRIVLVSACRGTTPSMFATLVNPPMREWHFDPTHGTADIRVRIQPVDAGGRACLQTWLTVGRRLGQQSLQRLLTHF
ncbi:hypothetical protein [Variovorax ginsengisoli]|uniref:Uncharacterized protein n=1 Tax=Variovorax ginsengisoli TaxID=363844 RepID=A0ABT8SFK4_9BURK|nr:hypothetical protein [Variovorax ginsengisoli]MDN8618529.1 hypothetical protein [Variovorax ginsengisoli]MDO1537699.1 hypothetical protein [Variovorax ginsengisoli]